ncbi:UNVERIFIED_CONTAM: hypothetical protein Slati_0224700 [Sesamum latifolium]|uniref:RNase H type-1 domain-containing protein n=1 Tax=Sesamum latifolium TaxID=2727402 RepID=A0AAW2YCF2_9LAMI
MGALFNNGSEVGIGVVTRDHLGSVIHWIAHRFHRIADAQVAETLAAREAVDLAERMHWQHVIFEGDCLNLITKLNSQERDFSDLGPLIGDIIDTSGFLSSAEFCLYWIYIHIL